jgi:hypothetical protein
VRVASLKWKNSSTGIDRRQRQRSAARAPPTSAVTTAGGASGPGDHGVTGAKDSRASAWSRPSAIEVAYPAVTWAKCPMILALGSG